MSCVPHHFVEVMVPCETCHMEHNVPICTECGRTPTVKVGPYGGRYGDDDWWFCPVCHCTDFMVVSWVGGEWSRDVFRCHRCSHDDVIDRMA